MKAARRASAAAALAGAALALGACQGAEAASQEADLRQLVAAERQCAPLIAGSWPIELGADALRAPGVDALVAAGLIQREEVRADPLARPGYTISIAPAGREWIELRRLREAGNETPFLCYGRRELVSSTPVAGDGETAAYRFRVVEPAPWVERDDILAAFPFLRTALSGPIEAENPARLRDGKWRLPENSEWSAGAALEKVGFYPCRRGDREKACG